MGCTKQNAIFFYENYANLVVGLPKLLLHYGDKFTEYKLEGAQEAYENKWDRGKVYN